MSHCKFTKNCCMCAYYESEELYNYVYVFDQQEKKPLIHNINGFCFLGNDKDSEEHLIHNFDRTIERSCCSLGLLQTALEDKDLQKAQNKSELYELFKQKYRENNTIDC